MANSQFGYHLYSKKPFPRGAIRDELRLRYWLGARLAGYSHNVLSQGSKPASVWNILEPIQMAHAHCQTVTQALNT